VQPQGFDGINTTPHGGKHIEGVMFFVRTCPNLGLLCRQAPMIQSSTVFSLVLYMCSGTSMWWALGDSGPYLVTILMCKIALYLHMVF